MYQSSAATELKYTISWSWSDSSSWGDGAFGSGSSWAAMTKSSSSQTCTFSTGYDQPAEFNMGEIILHDNAYDCCAACKKDKSKGD